ncbi:hypothetical protein ACKU05_027535 [Klebsiella pneumoniae]
MDIPVIVGVNPPCQRLPLLGGKFFIADLVLPWVDPRIDAA